MHIGKEALHLPQFDDSRRQLRKDKILAMCGETLHRGYGVDPWRNSLLGRTGADDERRGERNWRRHQVCLRERHNTALGLPHSLLPQCTDVAASAAAFKAWFSDLGDEDIVEDSMLSNESSRLPALSREHDNVIFVQSLVILG